MERTHKAAVLFVTPKSIYKSLPECDCFDAARDARTWLGGCPVVAHPPCRTWGMLKGFAKAPADEHDLALWAVDQVRVWGGVLEHPAASALWDILPEPGWLPDEWGGWTLECDQFHWGHLARKRTRLYIVGTSPAAMPAMPHRDGSPSHVVTSLSGRRLSAQERRQMPGWRPECGRAARLATPPAFARWLVEVAMKCKRR